MKAGEETIMFNRIVCSLILATLLATLAGCGATPTPTAVPAKPAAAFPLTLTDAAGRVVTVKALPQRIVSLSPSVTEDLFAVGAGEQVVGVTTYCNYPEEAAKREKIGGYSAKTISIEKVVALKPDLIIAEASTHADVIAALEPLGLTVVALKATTFDQVYATLDTLGKLTGHSDTSAQVVADMKAKIKSITDKTSALPQDKRVVVFWEIWDEPLMTAGPGTFPGQILEMAGGINIFADVTKDWPQVSAEEIVKRSPAAIMGPDTHGDKLTVDQIAKRPGWERLPAVTAKRIYLINGDTSSRPSPRLALALEETARALHPDLFK
jgi:iron complex transport system substrate-binding protein